MNKYIAMAQIYFLTLDANRRHHGLDGLDLIKLHYREHSLLILGVSAQDKEAFEVSKMTRILSKSLKCRFDAAIAGANIYILLV